tara:strand:- start:7612 stop:7977 length:366 start_codon:yes stop_codon:yes gene_type:complete
MIRQQALLNIFLGLILLVQGFAVAGAPRAQLTDAASTGTADEMPCHGQMLMQSDESGENQPSCCNDSCPNMTTCALGAMTSVTVPSMILHRPTQVERGFTPIAAPRAAFCPLLRPPISLHV